MDDSPLMREKIREVAGMNKSVDIIGEADNGLDAIRLVEELNPDLVTLDIRMPVMNGLTALQKIRETGSKAVLCILTNYTDSHYRERCLSEGANYFIGKSDGFVELGEVIAELEQSVSENSSK